MVDKGPLLEVDQVMLAQLKTRFRFSYAMEQLFYIEWSGWGLVLALRLPNQLFNVVAMKAAKA
jgi:hypothetical protein